MFSTLGSMLAAGPKAFALGNRFPNVCAVDFTDTYYYSTQGKYGSMYVRDQTTPLNNFKGSPVDKFTISRTSIGTYINANGHIATANSGEWRFTHDPLTRQLLGLIRENTANNLFTRSNEFGNSAWTKVNAAITSNTVIGPDGTLSGQTLIEDSANSTHAFQRTVTIPAANVCTFSIFAKPATNNRYVRLRIVDSPGFTSGFTAVFDANTGAVTANSIFGTGANTSAKATQFANGWWRFEISCVANSTTTSVLTTVFMQTSSGISTIYQGDGVSGVHFYGAMAETGYIGASTYVPTTTAAVLRQTDDIQLQLSNIPSLQTQGSMYVKYIPYGVLTPGNRVGRLESNSTSYIQMISSPSVPSLIRFDVFDSGVLQSSMTLGGSGTLVLNTEQKTSARWAENDFAGSSNGNTSNTDITGTVPPITTLNFTGHMLMQQIILVPQLMSNNELQAITRRV